MSEDLKVPVAVIAGPTGVGKTAVAVALPADCRSR
jgi:tRNA A37 N6-isopentenylltransferase MiaA